MAPIRLSERRRRSSHAIFTPAKPGVYGQQQQQRPVTFAPNVTPITFTDITDDILPSDDPSNPTCSSSSTASLFPPSVTPAPGPTRKRCPPGKRRSQGYIPRPPNAFMLFRADFVRQKHVPGSIETNHGSLSKIIGTCWRQLPFDEKRVWEVKAKQEKAKHKAMYPEYRFRPVHNKNKNKVDDTPASSFDDLTIKRKEKQPTTEEDERRCDEVAQLLLEGKKGDELAQAVRNLDMERERRNRELEVGYLGYAYDDSRRNSYTYSAGDLELDLNFGLGSRGESPMLSSSSSSTAPSLHAPLSMFAPTPTAASFYGMNPAEFPRRPSSVPLPTTDYFGTYTAPSFDIGASIALPSLPFTSRPVSPVGSIARHNQQFFQGFPHPFDNNNNNNDFQFQPIAPSPQYAQSAFPSLSSFVQPNNNHYAFGMYPTPNSQRSSLGLGHRRASSAQPMLTRSWAMPVQVPNQVQRDHSPLPDVESGLFNDFSFGGSSLGASSRASNTVNGDGELELNNVDPREALDVAPTEIPSNGVGVMNTTSANTSAPSSLYSGSPPSVDAGLPDMPLPHSLDHMAGMGEMNMSQCLLDMSAYTMYGAGVVGAGVVGVVDGEGGMYGDVDPIEHSHSHSHSHSMDGMGHIGGMEMKAQDGYFDGMGAGVYEV